MLAAAYDWHVGDEGYDDELQSDQGVAGRPDDHVEVLSSSGCCHSLTESLA
jgi:hypothetical protein